LQNVITNRPVLMSRAVFPIIWPGTLAEFGGMKRAASHFPEFLRENGKKRLIFRNKI